MRLPRRERAAAALKEFAESFRERNPHLRVFNMVLHMDEATPHLHVDFIPVATEQSRGLSTRVSMKQALKQQGFEGQGRKQTEWNAWMDREKVALKEIARCMSLRSSAWAVAVHIWIFRSTGKRRSVWRPSRSR